MRSITLSILCLAVISAYSQEVKREGVSTDLSHGNLKVSENKRFLVFEDGTPFFYLGCTAWQLFHRLTREEAVMYLENRREKGFTVIQAVALAELDGLNTPNIYGQAPLINNDPLRPNEGYFEHVDFIINEAEKRGIFIGLLPTWGDKVDRRWGTGPVVFAVDNAYKYGQWIATRYKDKPNIIWINGGDRPCDGEKAVWDALGRGIKSVDKNHLMTFHPWGESSSSSCFQDANWLDFNMFQSGHSDKYIANYQMITLDYGMQPVKPCMDGEPNYEDHPVNWNGKYGWFDDEDVRRQAYWALFAGAHGNTYGCHPIWQFLDKDRQPVGNARHTWKEVIDLPGAWDMMYVRKLMESRPFQTGIPDQTLITSDPGSQVNHIQCIRGEGYVFVYLPANSGVSLNCSKLNAANIIAWWYNPRTGEAEKIGEFKGSESNYFQVPVSGTDWVLVLDDAANNYPTPGY